MNVRRYESPEHESLRAVLRCLTANFGLAWANQRAGEITRFFGVRSIQELSPFGANACRKQLERSLPLRGDYLA